MPKLEMSTADLLRVVDHRLAAAGLDHCHVENAGPVAAARPFGRNWQVDIVGAQTGAEFDKALQIVRDLGAEINCNDFPIRAKPRRKARASWIAEAAAEPLAR